MACCRGASLQRQAAVEKRKLAAEEKLVCRLGHRCCVLALVLVGVLRRWQCVDVLKCMGMYVGRVCMYVCMTVAATSTTVEVEAVASVPEVRGL